MLPPTSQERLGLKDSHTMSLLTLVAKSASSCHGNLSWEQKGKATAQASHTKPIVPCPLPALQLLVPSPPAAPAFLLLVQPGELQGPPLPQFTTHAALPIPLEIKGSPSLEDREFISSLL